MGQASGPESARSVSVFVCDSALLCNRHKMRKNLRLASSQRAASLDVTKEKFCVIGLGPRTALQLATHSLVAVSRPK